MPSWLQQILIGLGAFAGGRVITSVGDRMQESKELRRSVDKLTVAVEQVPAQLLNLQVEIREVGARNEAQLTGVRAELHQHKMEQERRFSGLEERLDATVERVNRAPAPSPAWTPEPRVNMRVDQEMRCYRPPMGDPSSDR